MSVSCRVRNWLLWSVAAAVPACISAETTPIPPAASSATGGASATESSSSTPVSSTGGDSGTGGTAGDAQGGGVAQSGGASHSTGGRASAGGNESTGGNGSGATGGSADPGTGGSGTEPSGPCNFTSADCSSPCASLGEDWQTKPCGNLISCLSEHSDCITSTDAICEKAGQYSTAICQDAYTFSETALPKSRAAIISYVKCACGMS